MPVESLEIKNIGIIDDVVLTWRPSARLAVRLANAL